MQYNQPFDQPLIPTAPYVNGNPGAGIAGSIPPAAQMEYPQREIVNAALLAGLTPTNGDLTQLAQAMSIGLWLGTMSGSANALADVLPTLATTSDGSTQYAIPSLQPGMTFHGIIPGTNTGPATMTLTGFGTAPGAKPIVRRDGSALQPGDQVANAIGTWKWDGTSYRIMGLVPSDVQAVTLFYGPDTSTTANTVTVAIPAFAAGPTVGRAFEVKIANTFTGASQINVNGSGLKTITRADGTPTQAGDAVAGQDVALVYDGTNVQIQNLLSSFVPPQNALSLNNGNPGTGTWTVPAGITSVLVTMIGGGGGGGGSNSQSQTGGGGGGAGYIQGWLTVTPGAVLSWAIGAGGAAGVGSSGANAGTGGTTSFAAGALQCTGGLGGTTNSGGGGNGGNPVIASGTPFTVIRGANGGNGSYIISSNTNTGIGGFGAPCFSGFPTPIAFAGGINGFPGCGGTGGCQATGSTLGGVGGPGYITLQY